MTSGGLNREQLAASAPGEGVHLAIAGAGTGKTRVLVERIHNLLATGAAQPGELLVLTFSRKAAEELQHRVAARSGELARGLTAGTFHSFCLSMLGQFRDEYMAAARLASFPRVLEAGERAALIRELIRARVDDFLGLPVGVIERILEELPRLKAGSREKLERTGILRALKRLDERFREEKRLRATIDFDDMMEGMIGLLEADEGVRESLRARFRFILVDEFQDTSARNLRLITLLLPPGGGNLFVVGDDWQSIYAFRDSRVEYIVRFKNYFPGAVVHKLTVNYRSAREIVRVSNRFIRRNRFRTRKLLSPRRPMRGDVGGREVGSFEEELEALGDLLPELVARYGSVAVLFRNNWQGNLIRRRIPSAPDLEKDGKLALMTMHASKGLEFPAVIICGVSDEVIPDAFAPLEEERRLFYVALTRAKDCLRVIYHRNPQGGIARFAKELGFRPRTRDLRGERLGPA